MRYILMLMIAFFGSTSMLMAFEEPLKDAYQEQRAKGIFKALKCEVCAGQSVMDSNSEFAVSARSLVRDKILAGMNDEQIYDTLRNNYGDQIMFKPAFEGNTILLWLIPFILVFAGFIIVLLVLRMNRKAIKLN